MNRMAAAVMVGLAAVLAAIGLLTGKDDSDRGEEVGGKEPSIAAVARGVERVRQLRFEHLPRVRHVSGEQARSAGLREMDRELPRHALLAEQRVLELLGLLPPGADLRELLGTALASEVGGYYVPRADTLSIVDGFASGLTGEITLAHELTHALEDQHFGIEPPPWDSFGRDRSVADGALREGTATIVMVDYVVRKQAGVTKVPAAVRARVLKALDDAAVPESSGLPRYLRENLVFPYAVGARLVDRIQRRGGWSAVNRAFGRDAPVSSEQVMHPAKYDSRERPVRVRVPAPGDTRLVEQGDFGEFDTEQLLRAANGRARSKRAAAGWGGGGFVLWRREARYGLTLGWVWDSARDAREFAAAARHTAERLGGASVNSSDERVELLLTPRE
jgi:hypothetical protein